MMQQHLKGIASNSRKGLSRAEFLRLAALFGVGALLGACAPLYSEIAHEPLAAGWESVSPDNIGQAEFQALNRMTFGPRLIERWEVAENGLKGWIEEQLSPVQLADQHCDLLLRQFNTLKLRAVELVDLSDKIFDNKDKESVPGELRRATLIRQVFSKRQIFELMVAFWTDHFNISIDKGDCWFLKTVDDRQVIRKHALGSFHDLLIASARSPAMLVYLDNQANHKGKPNENYARELMELQTLGVEGGYSQRDVSELARCLTGWTVKEHFWRGEFNFDEGLHDPQPKIVLGETIQPAGLAEAEGVIEKLAQHPNTAHFIAYKLARYFIADHPPSDLVDRAADAFKQSKGDISEVLRPLLLDGLPGSEPRFKRPVRFITSALRQINAKTDGGAAVQDVLTRMGQPYFGWPTPDGYPVDSESWLGNLMPRWQFAYNLAYNNLAGTSVELDELSRGISDPDKLMKHISELLLGKPMNAQMHNRLKDAVKNSAGGEANVVPAILSAILASPDFQWH